MFISIELFQATLTFFCRLLCCLFRKSSIVGFGYFLSVEYVLLQLRSLIVGVKAIERAANCVCRHHSQQCSESKEMAANRERTFIMVKPDGVQRGIVGKIIKRFEQKGFKLVALKLLWPSEELLKKHYADLASRPFFPGLVKYMGSGPVVPMVWEGLEVVKTGRVLLGATNPADSAPGTIRGDLCIQVGRNICHGSDSVESAKKEIALWFGDKEVVDWTPANKEWVYED